MLLGFLLLLTLNFVSAGNIRPPSVLDIKTKFGYFNASFWWTVTRLQYHNFGNSEEANPLTSPLFTAVDYANNDAKYEVQFKIDTVYNEVLSHYTVTVLFSQSPQSYTFCYIISDEWKCPVDDPMTLSSLIIKNDVDFVIKFYMSADFNTHKQINEEVRTPAPSQPYSGEVTSFRTEMLKMFEEDSGEKFTIECGGEELTAFKSVMRARSPVFRDLLSNGTDRLRITDFQPQIVQKMINFCNNDTIDDYEYAETSLFAIGYEYQIEALMAITSQHIAATASIDNAVARLKFAHFYGYEVLKKWFFAYIVEHFLEVSKTETFKTLDVDLYKLFMEALLKENKIH